MKTVKGFSLIEIIIVVIIIGIISITLLPRTKAHQRGVYDTARLAYLRDYAIVIMQDFTTREKFLSTSMCSDAIQEIYADYINKHAGERSGNNYAGVDECVGQYKYIPFTDNMGGIMIAAVDMEKNANFIYSGGLSEITVPEAIGGICKGSSCGSKPRYHVIIMRD